ncbi:Mediator of RNA polymerase II transcription subunit 17 [Termitomyces sp. T112]|nr:Mediator of RNA polymerase II transcription subunit 17 [Termitomyces sp. T112]
MDELSFKEIRLSLERPYKDDNGDRIPILFDITPEGRQIYEKKENPTKALGDNLRRIFVERGVDFFDRTKGHEPEQSPLTHDVNTSDTATERPEQDSASTRTMNVEELLKMRAEIVPQLFTSLGEITLARDLLASLLNSSSQSQPENLATDLSAIVVTKPPPIVSVQAFNAQLTIGSKDEALRKAANVFKSAAGSMDRGRIKGEKYWVDALKVRRANWGLNPAPLPFGSATGKGADKTSKDFLISYSLEESPAVFRRQAVARMASDEVSTHGLVFLHRQYTRLRVSVSIVGVDGICITSQNTLTRVDENGPEVALKGAQQEIVEQEIFSLLVQEAGNLPTASARVSERLIVIDAAHATELKFELLEDEMLPPKLSDELCREKCNLIYFALHALLLRRHGFLQAQRLGTMSVGGVTKDNLYPPPVLQPIIDILQYQVFCERIKVEIDKMISALSVAGIQSSLRFNPVGEIGRQLVQLFDNNDGQVIGGEAVLRIDDRHTIRLTFLSPSSLTAHLPQATLTISSIPQLYQLLADEVERCLLYRICEQGRETHGYVGGTWFVDSSRCVGRWEGCVLNFHISFGKDFTIDCSAFQLHKKTPKQGQLDRYSSNSTTRSLFSWIQHIITTAAVKNV